MEDKVKQIKDRICNHMLSVDLDKLPMYELISYINAYKALEGYLPLFQGFNGCSLGSKPTISDPDGVVVDSIDTSKGD